MLTMAALWSPNDAVSQSLAVAVTPIGSVTIPMNDDNRASFVDTDVPTSRETVEDMHVLIIANGKYKTEKDIATAANDGKSIKTYCTRTLGIPEKHVDFRSDLSKTEMEYELDAFVRLIELFPDDRFMFFYIGHGMPGESDSYLVPVDSRSTVNETQLKKICVSRSEMMGRFASAKPRQLVVYLESCFSGANSGTTAGSMDDAARDMMKYSEGTSGLRLSDDAELGFGGNIILLSACSSRETACALPSEGHNAFTFEFLKALKRTGGDITWGQLFNDVQVATQQVAKVERKLDQTPSITVSSSLDDSWKNWHVK